MERKERHPGIQVGHVARDGEEREPGDEGHGERLPEELPELLGLGIDPDLSNSVARGSGHAADGLLWEAHSGELDACVDCGAPLRSQEVPDLGDERAWTSLAQEHRPGCRWIATRGRRRSAPVALGRRTA